MTKNQKYDFFISLGVKNYIQTLENFNLIESITKRLKYRNGIILDDIAELIESLYEESHIDLCKTLFSDLEFGDGFNENLLSNISRIINSSFNEFLDKFEITYIFYKRYSNEHLGELKFNNGIDFPISHKQEIQNFNLWMAISDPIIKICAIIKGKTFEYIYSMDNYHCSNLLSSINNFNYANNIKEIWHPLPSEYYEYYMLSSKQEYELIKNNNLILPENYESNKFEYPIRYAKW